MTASIEYEYACSWAKNCDITQSGNTTRRMEDTIYPSDKTARENDDTTKQYIKEATILEPRIKLKRQDD
jgi:hypothetical protein